MRWALLLLLTGCTPPLAEKPDQERLVEMVWSRFAATSLPPPIEWREDRCPEKDGPAAVVYEGVCYSGLYLRDDRALIAWRGSFHQSAFTHELMHAWQWGRAIDDPDHKRSDEWQLVASIDQGLLE